MFRYGILSCMLTARFLDKMEFVFLFIFASFFFKHPIRNKTLSLVVIKGSQNRVDERRWVSSDLYFLKILPFSFMKLELIRFLRYSRRPMKRQLRIFRCHNLLVKKLYWVAFDGKIKIE